MFKKFEKTEMKEYYSDDDYKFLRGSTGKYTQIRMLEGQKNQIVCARETGKKNISTEFGSCEVFIHVSRMIYTYVMLWFMVDLEKFFYTYGDLQRKDNSNKKQDVQWARFTFNSVLEMYASRLWALIWIDPLQPLNVIVDYIAYARFHTSENLNVKIQTNNSERKSRNDDTDDVSIIETDFNNTNNVRDSQIEDGEIAKYLDNIGVSGYSPDKPWNCTGLLALSIYSVRTHNTVRKRKRSKTEANNTVSKRMRSNRK